MWFRWSQKTKFYPSNSSDPSSYIAGVQGLSRGEGNSHEGSMQSGLAKAMESAKEWTAQRSLWNSWSSPKVVITSDGNRSWSWKRPILKALMNSSHPLSLRLNSTSSKRLSLNLSKVEDIVVQLLNHGWLFCDPIARQAPLSMWFSKQEYWSSLLHPPLGDPPNPGIKPMSPALEHGFFTTEPPGKPKVEDSNFLMLHVDAVYLTQIKLIQSSISPTIL